MRLNSQGLICTLDIHCNFRGTCSSDSGINVCVCDQGYFGTYCDFSGNELQDLRNIVISMVNTVLGIMQSRYELIPFDLELIGNLVRGVTSKPDLVDDETFLSVISLLQYVSNSTVYANKPVATNVTRIIMEAFSNSMAKLSHSYKLRRAYSDSLLLGMGLSLLQWANAFQLSSNPSSLSNITSQQYFISDSNKPYLIGGITSPRKTTQYMSNQVLTLYQTWGR